MEMEGKSSMAEKMDNKKKPAPTLLPVSVDKKNQQQQPRAAPPDPFLLDIDNVQLVNLWTFSNALAVTVSLGVVVVADTFIHHYALVIGMLWCSTPQTAFGALALLLPCHYWRVRRAAAYAGLAITVASHCMFAGSVLVVVRAAPEGPFVTIVGTAGIFILAVGDLLGFLALLRGQWAMQVDQ